jgi:RES domain-containing protein
MRADVAWVPIAGIWARQSRPGVRGDEPSHSDARWQRAQTPAAYFADSDATAWAELYRGLAERGLAPEQAFPRDVRVDLVRVADLSREKARRAFGLPRMSQSQAHGPTSKRSASSSRRTVPGDPVRVSRANAVAVRVRVRGRAHRAQHRSCAAARARGAPAAARAARIERRTAPANPSRAPAHTRRALPITDHLSPRRRA